MQASVKSLRVGAVLLLALLAGCSSLNPFSGKKARNQPAPLATFTPTMKARTLWTASVGKSDDYFLMPAVTQERVYAAGADGELAGFDVGSGKSLWRAKVAGGITAGVATDGNTVVVAGKAGSVIAFDASSGKQRWTAQAPTEILSAPAIGAGMVVVRSIDNKITAYDAENGSRRWFVQRTAPPLVLRAAPGIVISDGVAYVALPAGRLLALSATTGVARWEASVSEPRGATELERVADVSGMPVIQGRDICAASYQGRIACLDAVNGGVRWAREFSAEVGPGIDPRYVFGADERGNVLALSRESGGSLWRNTSLAWRGLSSPVSFGRAVVVGDREGYLHFLSREEGALLARVEVGAAVRSAPVATGESLLVQTVDGKLLALSPN